MTLLLHLQVLSRVKLCLVSAFPDIVTDCPKIRGAPHPDLDPKSVDPVWILIRPNFRLDPARSDSQPGFVVK